MRTRRRTRGEGSIWQRKDGRWGASARVVSHGARKVWQTTRRSRQEAIVALRRIQHSGAAVGGRATFAEWLDGWLTEIRASIRPKTYESYEAVVRLWLKPAIGNVRLSRLEPQHISKAVLAAKDAGLSSRTQAYIRSVARVAIERAVRLGRVTENVAKLSSPVRIETREIHPFSRAEFEAFRRIIVGDRLEALYLLAIVMGLRKGELLGLQWQDVADGKRGGIELRVTRQLQRVGGKLQAAGVKTARARRAIELPRAIADVLRHHRKRQDAERAKMGEIWRDGGWIFTTRIGTPIDPRKLLGDFYSKQKAAGITPRRSFHSLRHDAATALLVAGVDIKAISALLGHSSERFTHDTYTHLVPQLAEKVTKAASARLRKKSK